MNSLGLISGAIKKCVLPFVHKYRYEQMMKQNESLYEILRHTDFHPSVNIKPQTIKKLEWFFQECREISEVILLPCV